MNLDKLNQWLSLTANLGVIVGIAFLAIELNQASRIAMGSAEAEFSYRNVDFTAAVIENPQLTDLVEKLIDPEAELDSRERVLAVFWAINFIELWSAFERSFDNGLISGETYNDAMKQIPEVLISMPQLAPFFASALKSRAEVGRESMEVWDRIHDELDRYDL